MKQDEAICLVDISWERLEWNVIPTKSHLRISILDRRHEKYYSRVVVNMRLEIPAANEIC